MAGYHGFYYHFLHMHNGQRFGTSELSTVDTALLLGGVLLAQTYFDRDTRAEKEIRDLAERIYGRVEWTWAQNRPPIDLARLAARDRLPALRLARLQRGDARLHPGARLADAPGRARGVEGMDWRPTRTRGARSAARSSCRSGRCSAISTRTCGSTSAASRTSTCASKGIDYFENSRRAAYAHREYCDPEPDALARLRQRDLGPDRVRRPGRHGADLQQRGARLLHLRGARHGRDAPARRRHDRADRRGRLDRVRAGDRDPDDPRVPRALRRAPVSEVRLPRCGQPELHVHRTCRCGTARSSRTSAGSTTTISASTRARSWR